MRRFISDPASTYAVLVGLLVLALLQQSQLLNWGVAGLLSGYSLSGAP